MNFKTKEWGGVVSRFFGSRSEIQKASTALNTVEQPSQKAEDRYRVFSTRAIEFVPSKQADILTLVCHGAEEASSSTHLPLISLTEKTTAALIARLQHALREMKMSQTICEEDKQLAGLLFSQRPPDILLLTEEEFGTSQLLLDAVKFGSPGEKGESQIE